MSVSMKVPVAHLLANAEKLLLVERRKHEKALFAHGKAVAKRDAAEARRRGRVARVLATVDPDKVTVDQVYRNGHYHTVLQVPAPKLGKLPTSPREPVLNVSYVENDIRILKATNQETLTVKVGTELGRYV